MSVLRKGNSSCVFNSKLLFSHAIIRNDRLQVSDEQEESSLTAQKRKQRRKGKKAKS